MTQSKPIGHNDLKIAGLDGTWIPRGHYPELSFKCSKGHLSVHHPLVRFANAQVHNKGDALPRVADQTLFVQDCDGTVVYSVNPSNGQVTIKCSICGEVLAVHTPNPDFKHFQGQMITTYNEKVIQ